MADKVMVQVKFSEQTVKGKCNDVLYYTQDEYAKLKEADIEADKLERVNSYIAMKSVPPAELVPLTREELIEQLNQQQVDVEHTLELLKKEGTKKDLEELQQRHEQIAAELGNAIDAKG